MIEARSPDTSAGIREKRLKVRFDQFCERRAVVTTCGHCGAELRVAFRAGKPQQIGPELLWLAEGVICALRSARRLCCCAVRSTGARGRMLNGGRGELLDAAEASRRGGADWAGCADAVRVLA